MWLDALRLDSSLNFQYSSMWVAFKIPVYLQLKVTCSDVTRYSTPRFVFKPQCQSRQQMIYYRFLKLQLCILFMYVLLSYWIVIHQSSEDKVMWDAFLLQASLRPDFSSRFQKSNHVSKLFFIAIKYLSLCLWLGAAQKLLLGFMAP